MGWKEDLNYGLAAFGLRIPDELPIDHWAHRLTAQPARNTAALVAASSLLFYIAEKDQNPKVNDIFDAMVYCSTCLSVGYGDIFARTPAGKLIGTTLMTIGPALSGATLDGSREVETGEGVSQHEILAALKEILERIGQKESRE